MNLDLNGDDYMSNKKLKNVQVFVSRISQECWLEVMFPSDVRKLLRICICRIYTCHIHAKYPKGAACAFLLLPFDVINFISRECAL